MKTTVGSNCDGTFDRVPIEASTPWFYWASRHKLGAISLPHRYFGLVVAIIGLVAHDQLLKVHHLSLVDILAQAA